jgi:transcription elongation factor
MTAWEYKFIECVQYREDWYPAFENGDEVPNWKAKGTLAAYANELGSAGWELVTVATSAAGTHTDYVETLRAFFKRPKGG